MADHRITDFIDKEAIEKLTKLKDEMVAFKTAYIDTAKELQKGLNMSVTGIDDLRKQAETVNAASEQASRTTEALNRNLREQSKVIGDTTATLAREYQERAKANQAVRDEYDGRERVKSLLEQVNGTYAEHVRALNLCKANIKDYTLEQKRLDAEFAAGKISQSDYASALDKVTMKIRESKQEKSNLENLMRNEERLAQAVDGSYNQMAQQLELLKKAYKSMTDEEKSSPLGRDLDDAIKGLDSHLKDLAEDMGEHQRNVGNYAIASRDGVVATDSLTEAMNQEARTTQDLIDQTKLLEEAKAMLDQSDSNYGSTLEALNAKIEDNKRRLADVSDIMGKQATTVGEAEAQNRRLSEAIKLVDVSTDGGKKKIAEYNAKIAQNKKLIEDATPALKEYSNLNKGLADQTLSLIGVNSRFGNSFMLLGQSAAKGGNLLDGFGVKAKAFGKSLLGLLSNPWVLTFLGIAGVAVGFKWWYDYNKGLIEASRLTRNFTNATGAAADKVTADMSALADHMDKGFKETIEAANVLVQQFGISWDEAYQKMEMGIVAGADMSGNMLANIERFGPALRDCGVSADQFMAILSATRNGIFSEDGIQNIVKASTRLRAMTKQTQESLDAIGISAKKMQSDLEAGNISMIEAVQQVSAKLKELPENSQEAGLVIKNVFGRTAAEGGQLLIKSIADVNTSLEKAIENMGDLGKLTDEQMKAERELQEVLMGVFKMSDTSFEKMTVQAKIYITQGLVAIIKKCVDIANWFIRMYNESLVFRGGINSLANSFKVMWSVAKAVLRQMYDSFSAAGTMLEGVFTLDSDKIKSGWRDGMNSLKGNLTALAQDLAASTKDAFDRTFDGDKLELLSYEVGGDDVAGPARSPASSSPLRKKTDDGGSKSKGSKEAEKRAREELKLLQELEDSKLELMADGHEKDLALIRQKYKKKIDAVKGDGETEKALRLQLAEQCAREVADCELKYQRELATIDLQNRLATVEKGSKMELDLKLAQIEASRSAELEGAKKTGADISLINDKFNKQRVEAMEAYAAERVEKAQQAFAAEAAIADNAYNEQLNKLNAKYAKELAAAGNNESKREEITRKHEADVAKLTEYYARTKAQASVDFIEQLLNTENLSADERAKIEEELAKAKIELEKSVTDAVIAENQRQVDDDKRSSDKRIENAQRWLQVASDGLNAINDLASAIFDAKIERIEAEQEANTEAGEAEQERIADLVEKKAITEEEGEARKRAAEAKTAKKNEELEKKKQALKYKQAVWDKANNVAQAGIATAMAIMQALSSMAPPQSWIMAGIAGAMGAVQIATILATPIPKYAKGTKCHPGGLAVVGDAGKAEVIERDGRMFITPDVPTIVDMPRGAVVHPDAEKLAVSLLDRGDIAAAGPRDGSAPVKLDLSRLERKLDVSADILKSIAYNQRGQSAAIRDAVRRNDFEIYKLTKV